MSFQIALSGLDAASTDLEVTSNNIANSRTNGFKEARAEFGDVFATSINDASASASGRGVRVNRIAQQFSQGTVDFTSRNLDLAINGDGFFVLKDGAGSIAYTRAGAYSADKDGFIVDHKGQKLQVYPVSEVTSTGETRFTTGELTDLQLPLANSAPQATDTITTAVNLDAAAEAPTIPFSRENAASYNYSTSSVLFDSLGASHTATFYYDKITTPSTDVDLAGSLISGSGPYNLATSYIDANGTTQPLTLTFTENGANIWDVSIDGGVTTFDTVNLTGAPTPDPITLTVPTLGTATQAIDFSTAGLLSAGTTALSATDNDGGQPTNLWKVYTYVDGVEVTNHDNNTLEFTTSGALNTEAGSQTPTDGLLTMNPYVPTADPLATSAADPISLSIDVTLMTQYGGDFAVSNITQDGYATGRLSGLDIDAEGVAFARYTNGQATALGKVALAKFNSPQNLTKLGDTNWAESFASGQALLGEATTSSFGAIQSGALEASNVDLAEQLVNLIVAQRSFQANSKVITSADQILQTIINI